MRDRPSADQMRLIMPAGADPARQTLGENVARLPSADRREKLRMLEALLFAAAMPLDEAALREHFTAETDLPALLAELQQTYSGRGVHLVRVAGKWAFRTAPDLAFLLHRQRVEQRKLSKAALETLAIIAYHQPVTRAEIEEVRGVAASKGTIDVLMEIGWVRMRGRKRVPGRPVTYGTADAFLEHFGFDTVRDLPGLAELKGAGLLEANLPAGFTVPEPALAALTPDEDPLEDDPQPELFDEDEDADDEAAAAAPTALDDGSGVDNVKAAGN